MKEKRSGILKEFYVAKLKHYNLRFLHLYRLIVVIIFLKLLDSSSYLSVTIIELSTKFVHEMIVINDEFLSCF